MFLTPYIGLGNTQPSHWLALYSGQLCLIEIFTKERTDCCIFVRVASVEGEDKVCTPEGYLQWNNFVLMNFHRDMCEEPVYQSQNNVNGEKVLYWKIPLWRHCMSRLPKQRCPQICDKRNDVAFLIALIVNTIRYCRFQMNKKVLEYHNVGKFHMGNEIP